MTIATAGTTTRSTATSDARRRARAALAGVGRAAVPVLIAFLVGGVVLAVTGHDPVEIYRLLAAEAFGGGSRIDATLAAATPLLFTSVAAAFAYRAGVFTIGAEGSFTLGGLAAAVVGAHVGSWPAVAAVSVSLAAACVAGVVAAVVPAVLRARWQVDEVVTTLMVNFIVAGVAAWAVQAFFQERGQANSATAYVSEAATLQPFVPPNLTNAGLVIALLLVAGYTFWFRRTTLGFEFRAVGAAPRFAVAQGLRTRTVVVVALLGAGLVAGLGGGSHALGVVHRYTSGFSASFGFTGIAIALLARFNPVGIVVGSVLFGALNAAGSTIQLFVDLPIQLVDILQGTVMVFAVVQIGLPRLLRRTARTAEVVA
jgi:general nucleoside transport system permease protein